MIKFDKIADLLPKIHVYSWGEGGFSTKVVKRIVKCKILNFGIFFYLLLFCRPCNMVVNRALSNIFENAGRREKRTKIRTAGVTILVYREYFSLLSVQVQIFADLVHAVSRKRLIVERNGPKFGPRG